MLTTKPPTDKGPIVKLLPLALATTAALCGLTACGSDSSLSDRQIADKFADHSACSDRAKYEDDPDAANLLCDADSPFVDRTFTFCREGSRADEPTFYYQDEHGNPIGITLWSDHLVHDVFETDREYGYCS